jgi:5-methylcytosine-specific restriction endonuclease McrA
MTPLVPGVNWTSGQQKHRRCLCRECVKAKGMRRRKEQPFVARQSFWKRRAKGEPCATLGDIRTLYATQGGKCAFSGLPIPPEVDALDHKTPRSRGGAHTIDNLQFLHRSINGMKHDMTMEEFTEFFDKVAFQRLLGGEV